jgi:hypothetical protein
MSDLVLAKIDGAARLLSEAKTVQEAKQIADVAEAARIYAKRVEASIVTVNYAAEIKIKAERLLGAMLQKTPKNTGAKGIGPIAMPYRHRNRPTLKKLGISLKQSSRAQKLAKIAANKFEQSIVDQKASGKELTTAAVLRAGQSANGNKKPVRRRAANLIPDGEDSDEVCWRRGLLYRAKDSILNAQFEDWSHFQVDLELVDAAARASREWNKLAAYLRKLYEHQKEEKIKSA